MGQIKQDYKNTETRHLTQSVFKRHPLERLQIMNGLFIHCHRDQCANSSRTLILRLTQADLMYGSIHLRPISIMKMDRNLENAWRKVIWADHSGRAV
jgi:hypothetical protein